MPKPLGYYLSAPPNSPEDKRLQEIESTFGSSFQQLTKQELLNILAYCSCICAGDNGDEMRSAYLSNKTELFQFLNKSRLFSLIPFLHSVISERSNEN